MFPTIGEENLKEHIVPFVKDLSNLFHDYDPLKWVRLIKLLEEQIEWKVEGIVPNAFKQW